MCLQEAEHEHTAEVEKVEKEKQEVESRLEEMKTEEQSLQAKVSQCAACACGYQGIFVAKKCLVARETFSSQRNFR